jgi:hypothetical protein
MNNYKNMSTLHVLNAKYWFLVRNKMKCHENGRHHEKQYEKLVCIVSFKHASK